MKPRNDTGPAGWFASLLRKATAAELRAFLEAEAAQNDELLHTFIIRVTELSSIPAEEKYALMVRSIFAIEKANALRFHAALKNYFETADRYFHSVDYFDAFLMATEFIRHYSRARDSSHSNTGDFLVQSFQLLAGIAASDAAFDLKEKLFDFLLNGVNPAPLQFTDKEMEAWLQALLGSSEDDVQMQKVIDLLAELTGANRSQYGEAMSEQRETRLLEFKLEALRSMNRPAEVRRLLEANRRIKSFRLQLIDECMKQRQWDEAKELIKEGRRQEAGKGAINVGPEWNELLLTIALEEHDVRSIRNLSMQLFLGGDYDFNHYRLMRQHYDESRWKSQVERLVTAIKKERSFATDGIHAVARIYMEEHETENLLRLMEKNAQLDFVNQYADAVKEKFPDEVLEIYRKAIRRFAEKYMGPEAYRMVAAAIRNMLSIAKSKSIVQSLLIELKVTYRPRKAFVEELNKVVM